MMGTMCRIITLLVLVVGLAECFHRQNQAGVRRAVCMRAPPCCPGHVCRAYQRFDASRPVAACSISAHSRPLYAPGSLARQRLCGRQVRPSMFGGRGQESGMRRMDPLTQRSLGVGMGGPIRGGPAGFEMGGTFGSQGRRQQWGGASMGQVRPAFPSGQMFPGQGQEGIGQSGFPEFPPMPTFGDQGGLAQTGGMRQDVHFGGQANTFATMPGQQQRFASQGQRSTGFDQQMFGSGGSAQAFPDQGMINFQSQGQLDASQIPFGSQQFGASGQAFSSGGSTQIGRGGGQGFGPSGLAQVGTSGQGFSISIGTQAGPGGQDFGSGITQVVGSGGQGFSSGGSSQLGATGRQMFSTGGSAQGLLAGTGQSQGGSGQGFSTGVGGQVSRGGQGFDQGHLDFGLPQSSRDFSRQFSGSIGGTGAPQPFLVESPAVSASAIGGSLNPGQGQSSAAQQPIGQTSGTRI